MLRVGRSSLAMMPQVIRACRKACGFVAFVIPAFFATPLIIVATFVPASLPPVIVLGRRIASLPAGCAAIQASRCFFQTPLITGEYRSCERTLVEPNHAW